MAYIKSITTTANDTYDIRSKLTAAIPYGECDSTSTATAFTATVTGLDALYDGACVMLKNGVVTSASGFTININGLGAKPCYNNMATGNDITPTAPTRDTTIFNQNYTMLFVYSESIVDGGGWICYRGYDGNTNTIGYQLRTNSSNMVAADTGYRYRIWLTSADGSKWVPINTSTSTNSTTARTLNTRAIDPFGAIVYRATNGTCNSGSGLGATGIWQQYTLTIGYSYVLTMTYPAPVYLRCTPQANGSAVMNDIVQALPSSNDGKIYIFLGIAYSATAMELQAVHPVYWHDGTGIRLWTGSSSSGSSVEPATATPLQDGTAAVGTSAKYAREDHVHPTDTSRQATLVSGMNIKTINDESLLGSGNISISGGGGKSVWYGTCSTSATTTNKVVECTGFALETGAIISIKFTYGNTLSTAAKFNVNSTGNITVKVGGTPGDAKNIWYANSVVTAIYDGTYWVIISVAGEPTVCISQASSTSTAAATTKVATIAGNGERFRTAYGSLVAIRFTNANTYTSGQLSLQVNRTSSLTGNAIAIYKDGTAVSATNTLIWNAGDTLVFMYGNSGTYWLYISGSTAYSNYTLPTASTTTLGGVKVDGTTVTVDSNGVISAAGGSGVSVTTTTVAISFNEWDANGTCTKSVTGVTTSNTVLATYAPVSKAYYTEADVYCSAQGQGALTFRCTNIPSAGTITINVMIIDQ